MVLMAESKNRRKWIIFAHCFNMDGRAASQTITDKIPFLTGYGIEPVIVSAPTGRKDKHYAHHQIFSPAPSGFIFEMRKVVEQKIRSRWGAEVLKGMVTLCCLPFLLIEKLIINLDSHWSWFITAGLKGMDLSRQHRPEILYSTAGPSSTHLAALLVKKSTGLTWIAEIHDPLVPEIRKERYQRHLFHKWLEQKIFEHADAVIYFTEAALENARQRTKISGNACVLRPGATPPEIEGNLYQKRKQIHFGHFGSLAPDRNLYEVIAALSRVLTQNDRLRDRVVLDVYGGPLDQKSREAVAAFGFEDHLVEHGRLEYDPESRKSGRHQIFEEMNRSDVLILLHGNKRISGEYIPSKMYEYLLTERPVAAMAFPGSELGKMLLNLGYRVVDPDRPEKIEAALLGFILQWEAGQLAPVANHSAFTVKKTVEQLVGIADQCLSEDPSIRR